jgi:hypothetical protein
VIGCVFIRVVFCVKQLISLFFEKKKRVIS